MGGKNQFYSIVNSPILQAVMIYFLIGVSINLHITVIIFSDKMNISICFKIYFSFIKLD